MHTFIIYIKMCVSDWKSIYIYTTITIVFEGDMLEDVCAVIWNIFSLWFLWPYLLPTFRSKLELNEARLLILFIVTKAYKVRAWLSRALCLGKIHFVTFPKQSKNQYYKLIADCTGTINMSGWAVERWDPLTAYIDVCSKQSLTWAVGKIPKNCGFVLPLILMIAFSKH